MEVIQKVADDIWIADGDEVSWYGMPYTTRTTIVRLENGELWIHSPTKASEALLSEVNSLGAVKHLVSPNKIHHLFLEDWKEIFPDAILYASPGLKDKRPDLKFDEDLKDCPSEAWKREIDQLIFKGSHVMEEVVFYHKSSRTLILTDLVENFHPNHFSGYKWVLAKLTGIVSPNGKTPLDWRMSFVFGKKQARKCLHKMIAWNPTRIIVAHGECVSKDAVGFLKRSFSWVGRI